MQQWPLSYRKSLVSSPQRAAYCEVEFDPGIQTLGVGGAFRSGASSHSKLAGGAKR
jgi:hypothetical protein